MSRATIIAIANAMLLGIHAAGLIMAHALGMGQADLIKAIPTACASLLGQMVTLTFALWHLLKIKPRVEIVSVEANAWEITLTLNLDCTRANGIVLHRIDAAMRDTFQCQGEAFKSPAESPCITVPGGQAVTVKATSQVLRADQEKIVRHRRLAIEIQWQYIAGANLRTIKKKLRNPFIPR